jgi:hypothetical protein
MEFIGRPLLVGINPSAVEPMDPGLTVKVDRKIAGKAKMIATHEGASVAQVLSEILQAPIDKRYAQMLRELEAGEKGGKP